MTGYTWYVGDLRTGKIARTVDLVNFSWSALIDDPGTLTGDFPVGAIGEDGNYLWGTSRSDAAPAKCFLAVSYTDSNSEEHFLNGGPIWSHKFVAETETLTLGAAGLWSYFDHRKVMPILATADNPATATVTYTGAQLGLIAKRLVELAQSHTGGNLPIVLPPDADLGGAGIDHTRTYPGYELGWVGERLKQLTEVEDGPEIQFIPRRRSDDPRFIEWVMRIGTEPSMLLSQSGSPWVFDARVPESPVMSISVDTDGSQQAFRAWCSGDGDGTGLKIGRAEDLTLVNAGWPLIEGEVRSTDNTTQVATLNAYATAAVATGLEPIETWSMTLNRDARPDLGKYAPGDFCTVKVKAGPYLPEHDSERRILSISGDTSATVSLSLANKVGA